MGRLICSKCGFKTNAVGLAATDIICTGCEYLEQNRPKKPFFKKGSHLADTMDDAIRDFHNLPDWMQKEENLVKGNGHKP